MFNIFRKLVSSNTTPATSIPPTPPLPATQSTALNAYQGVVITNSSTVVGGGGGLSRNYTVSGNTFRKAHPPWHDMKPHEILNSFPQTIHDPRGDLFASDLFWGGRYGHANLTAAVWRIDHPDVACIQIPSGVSSNITYRLFFTTRESRDDANRWVDIYCQDRCVSKDSLASFPPIPQGEGNYLFVRYTPDPDKSTDLMVWKWIVDNCRAPVFRARCVDAEILNEMEDRSEMLAFVDEADAVAFRLTFV